jgi:hypothetical protein
VQVKILTEFIENRIPVLARANRTGEIIWLLFLAIRLGLTISARRLTPLFSIENAFVALLGTYLFSEIARVGMRSVSAYLLPKGEFNPQFHVQCQHAVLPVADNLPHYKGFPASFGGVEEFVDW